MSTGKFQRQQRFSVPIQELQVLYILGMIVHIGVQQNKMTVIFYWLCSLQGLWVDFLPMVSLSTLLFQLATAAAGPMNTLFPVYFAAHCKEGISKGLGGWRGSFLYSFSFWEKEVSSGMACIDWPPFRCVATIWKNHLSIKMEDWF